MSRDDPSISSKDWLYSVMHDPTLPLSFRMDAAIALLPIECAQPRRKVKGQKLDEPPSVTIVIPPLPSAACARAEKRQMTRMTLIKGHG